MSWYTVEAGGYDTIYDRFNGTAYVPSTCTLPAINYRSATLSGSLCDVMNAHYPL